MACARRALITGSTIFGMQNGSQCRIDAKRKGKALYNRYGKSYGCTRDLYLGGFRANYVFRIRILRRKMRMSKKGRKSEDLEEEDIEEGDFEEEDIEEGGFKEEDIKEADIEFETSAEP